MKKELIELMSEGMGLLKQSKSVTPEEENVEQNEREVETIVVEFDFDIDDETNFDMYLNLRYFWNDWNPVLTDIH